MSKRQKYRKGHIDYRYFTDETPSCPWCNAAVTACFDQPLRNNGDFCMIKCTCGKSLRIVLSVCIAHSAEKVAEGE